MKLVQYCINSDELQDYLDKYQDKIKFIIPTTWPGCNMNGSALCLIIDEG